MNKNGVDFGHNTYYCRTILQPSPVGVSQDCTWLPQRRTCRTKALPYLTRHGGTARITGGVVCCFAYALQSLTAQLLCKLSFEYSLLPTHLIMVYRGDQHDLHRAIVA